MNQDTTVTLETASIHEEEDFNARTHKDGDSLDRLSASIARDGVLEPLLVRAEGDGKAMVVAGHRRLAAARQAGLDKVPVVFYDGDRARQVSLIENFHREDLDPIDAARGMKAIAEELDLTKPELAEQLDVSVTWVSERLRLLNLPAGAQEQIAAGVVPVEGERLLRKVAEVSPLVAECVCLMAKRRKIAKGEFVRSFGDLLQLTSEGRFPEKPTMIDVRRVTVSRVIADPKERAELTDRINEVDPYLISEDPQVRFEEAEIDAARAAGCLVEHRDDQGDYVTVAGYITDSEMAADLLRLAVERQEALAKKRAEEEAAWRSRSSELDGTPDEQKEARRAQRVEAKEKAARARKFNDGLGRKLLDRRGKATRKQHGLARAQALAFVLLADNREMAARGLRLVLPQLQEVETKRLKSGEPREKVSYANTDQCLNYLENRIEEARSEGEVLEVVGDALIAAILADEAELPQSKRVRWWTRAQDKVTKLLAADIKAVKPRATRKG